MTNLKTIFKQKSKLLLIVLSLLGMIFSYSCSCRNNSTAPVDDGTKKDDTQKGDTNIFSLTEDEATNQANNFLIYSTKLSRTNSLVIVKFNEQASNKFNATLKILNDGGTGLTEAMLEYNPENGRLVLKEDATTLENKGLELIKKLTDGTTKTVNIEFTLTPTETKTIKSRTVFTNQIQVIKTKTIIVKDTVKTELQKLNQGGAYVQVKSSTAGKTDNAIFNFTSANFDKDGTTLTTATTSGDDIGTIKKAEFKSKFNDGLNAIDKGDYSKIEITDEGSLGGANNAVATFQVKVAPKDKSVEINGADTFKIAADITTCIKAHADAKWE